MTRYQIVNSAWGMPVEATFDELQKMARILNLDRDDEDKVSLLVETRGDRDVVVDSDGEIVAEALE